MNCDNCLNDDLDYYDCYSGDYDSGLYGKNCGHECDESKVLHGDDDCLHLIKETHEDVCILVISYVKLDDGGDNALIYLMILTLLDLSNVSISVALSVAFIDSLGSS